VGLARGAGAEIAHAIEAHSFSAGIAPRTVERGGAGCPTGSKRSAPSASALPDARRALGRPLYAAADPFCDNRPADDGISAVDHFYTKLLKLEGAMQTASGRREARQRTEFLRKFLAQLRHEIGPSHQ